MFDLCRYPHSKGMLRRLFLLLLLPRFLCCMFRKCCLYNYLLMREELTVAQNHLATGDKTAPFSIEARQANISGNNVCLLRVWVRPNINMGVCSWHCIGLYILLVRSLSLHAWTVVSHCVNSCSLSIPGS
jgi:hypothetical protein